MGREHNLVRQAQLEHRLLRIRYPSDHPGEGITGRDVEVYAHDDRYFDAYCRLREDKRTFRFDRIIAIELLEETFDVDPVIRDLIQKEGWANRSLDWRRNRAQALSDEGRSSAGESAARMLRPRVESRETEPTGCFAMIISVMTLGYWP
jgi:predicted DNA-binding transcriptional regulator YafY